MTKQQIDFSTDEGLEIYRHSTSHIMAYAVKLLYPEAKLAIGPAISEGFYYDFDMGKPLSGEDLDKISQKMQELIKNDIAFTKKEISRKDAIKLFSDNNEPYKVELLNELSNDIVSLYYTGDFVDLCRGPHITSTGAIKAFKLQEVAGAYWRGDEKNKMLQRIYGTAFTNQEDLDEFLKNIEEAKRRDHRRLGKELDLYSIHEQAGPGLIYWHPKGARIRNIIERFWIDEHSKRGYELLNTPHIAKIDLWKKSGHWEFYKENMYSPMEIDQLQYIVKPMNCPGHILVYKTNKRSYRELPLRWAELGTVYRYERSGVLHGTLRVRGFTQDDAHIFCRPDQLKDEIKQTLELVQFMMNTFGFSYNMTLSTRPKDYIGTEESWEKATNALKNALEENNILFDIDPGAGVFYGPKIDVKIIDALGREWQGPTIQVDFNLPERFDVNYIGNDGKEHQIVMVHRAVLGSLERFFGILIEHYGGAFPLWLAPVQINILPISTDQNDHAEKIRKELEDEGLRVKINATSDKINAKIKSSELDKVPYMIIIGKKEIAEDTISIRKHKEGDKGKMALNKFIEMVKKEVSLKK